MRYYTDEELKKAAKACPKCHEKNVKVETLDNNMMRVVCLNCGNVGSEHDEYLTSIKAWNAESFGLRI